MQFLKYYGYLLLYTDYPLRKPFYPTEEEALTPLNILNCSCTTAGGSGYLECAKQESGQDILTHEAKHNKILTALEISPFQELLLALQS